MFDVDRWSKPLLLAGFAFFILSFARPTAFAQQGVSPAVHDSALPDAPEPQAAGSSQANPHPTGQGAITGTVFDANRDVLSGAQVTLTRLGVTPRTVASGSDGQFVFSGLPPGSYTLTVNAPGMNPYTSSTVPLRGDEAVIVPAITMSVSGGITSVTVSGNKEVLAEQQLHTALQQRIGGVIPNFYSTYDWNAPPMQAKQKFQLGIRSTIDPVALLSVAGLAGAEQYKNIFPAYGSGFEGYSKRYGAALANHASGILLGRAVFPAIFHQDPRYFYKGKGSIGSRALYAASAAVIARGDDGRWKPNYSRILGNFSAAAISNLYYPAADRGASLVLLNGLGGTGADAVANLIREFLLKHITSHVPKGENGEP